MESEVLKALKAMLSEAGIQNYEPEILTHLSDYIDHYISEIMEKSKDYMKHANRTKLDVSDVKLVLNEKRKQEEKCKPSWNNLIKIAKEHNKTNLPPAKEKCGIPIPSNALNNTNYRMRGLNTNNNQTPNTYQIPNYSTVLNELILNSSRNPAGVNAIIRKLTGNPTINLNHQHIIFKQQIPTKKPAENVIAEDLALKKRKTI